ncbi:hypothetical protein QUA81_19950 [Microcoleus sp. F6_B4]
MHNSLPAILALVGLSDDRMHRCQQTANNENEVATNQICEAGLNL